MLMDYEKKIIEKEIARLERAYNEAMGRYEVTGSRSTSRTMTRYRVLQAALERGLDVGSYAQALERANGGMMRKLVAAERALMRLRDEGRIPPDAAGELMWMIREG